MGKRSQSGCMKSLFNVFRRLLSDRKRKSGQSVDTVHAGSTHRSSKKETHAHRPSLKELMEEERLNEEEAKKQMLNDKQHKFFRRRSKSQDSIPKPSFGSKRGDKIGKLKDREIGMEHEALSYPNQRIPTIHSEAKKHLFEMLSNGDEYDDILRRQTPKTLGQILSLPEFVSPIGSPGRDWGNSFVTAQTRLSACGKSQKVDENAGWFDISHSTPLPQSFESWAHNLDENQDDEAQASNSFEVVHGDKAKETCSTRDEASSEGYVEISETVDPIPEENRALDISSESCSIKYDQNGEQLMQPLRIRFEEQDASAGLHTKTGPESKDSVFEYIETILQMSASSLDEFFLMSLTSDQILDPSLLDEEEVSSFQLCHDQKLMLDCINEVLMEVCERYFGCSIVKANVRPVPNMKNTVREVWEGVQWHLLPQPLPRTLDQIVKKDMVRTGTWMDLRVDAQNIGIEMTEAVLQELLEDTILCCIDESLENVHVSS